MPSKKEIKKVSTDEFKAVIQDGVPKGLFVTEENGLYFAADNSGNYVLFETFPSEESAMEWLNRGSNEQKGS